ncbi:hypothetical protein ACFRQM_47550, partial [Streptomyces sp. NPDC056831]|uniref:hypothetical protein n=1 Tax=Streptomyces sp. NPDC056831 TaxID=3345954 RepID=UPI00368B4112
MAPGGGYVLFLALASFLSLFPFVFLVFAFFFLLVLLALVLLALVLVLLVFGLLALCVLLLGSLFFFHGVFVGHDDFTVPDFTAPALGLFLGEG